MYNIHNLVHLADDAYRYGSLDKISAFPLKSSCRVRKPSFLIQQVIRRLPEGTYSSEAEQNLLAHSKRGTPARYST